MTAVPQLGVPSLAGPQLPALYLRPSAIFPGPTYYPLSLGMIPPTNGTPAIDRFFLIPFALSQSVVLDRIAYTLLTGGGAGAVGRCGIYNADQLTLKPTTLLIDGGQQSNLAGSEGVKITTVSLGLKAGVIYCAAYVSGVAPAGVFCHTANTPVLGYFQSTSLFGQQGWRLDQAYGALPLDLTAASLVIAQSGDAPGAVFGRFASVG